MSTASQPDTVQPYRPCRRVNNPLNLGLRARAELLEVELNRDALASTVQLNLFDGNPHGWKAYVSHVQNKVKWFGTGLSNIKEGARAEPSHDATDAASPVDASDTAVSPVEGDVRSEKRGWPWPEPRPKS